MGDVNRCSRADFLALGKLLDWIVAHSMWRGETLWQSGDLLDGPGFRTSSGGVLEGFCPAMES